MGIKRITFFGLKGLATWGKGGLILRRCWAGGACVAVLSDEII
jgi:hypothetical protein